jgi:hypothetical protein
MRERRQLVDCPLAPIVVAITLLFACLVCSTPRALLGPAAVCRWRRLATVARPPLAATAPHPRAAERKRSPSRCLPLPKFLLPHASPLTVPPCRPELTPLRRRRSGDWGTGTKQLPTGKSRSRGEEGPGTANQGREGNTNTGRGIQAEQTGRDALTPRACLLSSRSAPCPSRAWNLWPLFRSSTDVPFRSSTRDETNKGRTSRSTTQGNTHRTGLWLVVVPLPLASTETCPFQLGLPLQSPPLKPFSS